MNLDDIDNIDLSACTDSELHDLLDQIRLKVEYFKNGVAGAIGAILDERNGAAMIEKQAAAIDPKIVEYLLKNQPAAQSTEVSGIESQSGFGFDNK